MKLVQKKRVYKYDLPGDNGPPAKPYNAKAALRPLEKYLARKRALTNNK